MSIKEAIQTSVSENRTVSITVEYISDVQMVAVSLEYNVGLCEINPGIFDCWGWNELTPDDKQDWRLLVNVVGCVYDMETVS